MIQPHLAHVAPVAKRRNREIENTRGQDNKNKLYKDLLKVTRKTVGYAQRAVDILEARQLAELSLTCELRKVIEQTRRRVIDGEKVPADQKVLSIFEPHTDLIVKGKRDPLYGHKVCLTTGKSGLLIDCQVLGGNPNDTTLAVDAIERVEQIYGQPPRQAAFDAGFRSTANLHKIKDLGVEDVVFNKGG
ncbi:MAG: transposase, partial [Proteobacteria bacterium]|nr:transposase [Pseudomonadota bacterium]